MQKVKFIFWKHTTIYIYNLWWGKKENTQSCLSTDHQRFLILRPFGVIIWVPYLWLLIRCTTLALSTLKWTITSFERKWLTRISALDTSPLLIRLQTSSLKGLPLLAFCFYVTSYTCVPHPLACRRMLAHMNRARHQIAQILQSLILCNQSPPIRQ
jgi:hypothetical protein